MSTKVYRWRAALERSRTLSARSDTYDDGRVFDFGHHLDFPLALNNRSIALELLRGMTKEIMQFSLALEFLKACRLVLGDDSPAAIVGAIRADDQADWNAIQNIHAEILGEAATGQMDAFGDIRNVFIEACCRVLGEAYLTDPLKALCDVMVESESTILGDLVRVFRNLLDAKRDSEPNADCSTSSALHSVATDC